MLCDILGKQFTLQYCTLFKYLVPGQLQIIQNEMFSLLINFINKCILSDEKTDLAINIIMVSMEMFNYHIFVHIQIQKKTCRRYIYEANYFKEKNFKITSTDYVGFVTMYYLSFARIFCSFEKF